MFTVKVMMSIQEVGKTKDHS